VEYLGRDPLTALRGLARTTPSQRFANFLEVLTSVIETGGDVTPYFASKCSELQGGMRESQRKVITSLELLAEIYVILIAFAPLLFMTLFILMGALEPASEFILYLIMYAWIPVGSFAFIVLLATATGEVPTVRLRPRRRLAFRDVPMQESDASDRLLLKSLFRRRWGTVLVTPFHAARKTPEYILLVSVPIALVYLFLDPLQGIDWYGRAVAFPPFNLIFSPLLFTLLIALLPYAVVYELGSRRAEQIERSMPDFLRALRSSLSSGLSLPPAISVVSSSELGHLTEEIKRTDREIRWGASSLEALENLESRISISPNAAQALSVVRKASEAEEDISEVLDITRNDLETRRAMKEERKGAMFVYMLIIFVTFGVFLVTVYFIVTSFVAMPVTEAEAAGLALGGMDPELVKQMYFTSTCFSAIFGGLLAAQMGHGSLRSGLKYSLVMLLVTYVVFTWTVFPARPPIVIPEEI
jgi:flagellar protein FlaJ